MVGESYLLDHQRPASVLTAVQDLGWILALLFASGPMLGHTGAWSFSDRAGRIKGVQHKGIHQEVADGLAESEPNGVLKIGRHVSR